jgi:hypothetical protein
MANQLERYMSERKRQRREHPSLPEWVIRKIASDHVKKKR